MAAIFKCLNHPDDGPFLKGLGITDVHLVKYIAERSNGATKDSALDGLVRDRTLSEANIDRLRSIVEQFPI